MCLPGLINDIFGDSDDEEEQAREAREAAEAAQEQTPQPQEVKIPTFLRYFKALFQGFELIMNTSYNN